MRILRWFWLGLCWITLLGVIGAAGGAIFVYSRLDNEVQKYVLAEFQQRHPDLDLKIGSAQIVENRGLSIKNIECSVPDLFGQPRKLLHVDELFIECSISLQSLYQRNPRISRIVVRKPILRASRAADGTFSELKLLVSEDRSFLFPESGNPIPVDVENGTLLYDDAQKPAPPFRFTNINLALTPEIADQVQRILVKGSADGDFFRRINVEAVVLPESKHWEFTANCRQFDWTDDLWQYIPPAFAGGPVQPQGSVQTQGSVQPHPLFQGRFDFNIKAVSAGSDGLPVPQFVLGGTLTQGRLDLPQINRTLTELSTRFEISNDRIVIDKLTGNGDSARFAASFIQEGLPLFGQAQAGQKQSGQNQRQAELTVNVRELHFDTGLIEALSPFFNEQTKELLSRFDCEGLTDLHAQLSCRNGVWHPSNVSMQITDLGFTYRPYPYQVDRLSGNVYIDENAMLRFYLTSKPEAPIKTVIDGQYTNLFVDPAGKVSITGEQVPIDLKLLRTLPESVEPVVQSLHPSGKINARLVFELPPGNAPVNKFFDIALDRMAIQYDHFPYPLRDVTGSLQFDGTVWRFERVAGTNGTAFVRGGGYLRPIESDGRRQTADGSRVGDFVAGESQSNNYGSAITLASVAVCRLPSADYKEFVLNLTAEELPVDDQIIRALRKPEQQQLLKSLNAAGKVNLAAQIVYRTDDKRLNLNFQALPRAGFSLCADKFPYKIENVAGEIRYENGHIFAETLTGTHRSTKYRSGLDCRFNAEGQAVLRLAPLTVDQLLVDRELYDALPNNLRTFLESMQIAKPVNLSGGIEFRQTAPGEQTVLWDWNLVLHQNSAKLGFPVENIFGIVRLTGHSTPQQFWLTGALNLDSVMTGGFQATAVRGPFSFDGKQLRLGSTGAPNAPPNEPRRQPVTAQFCGGTIQAEGLVVWNNGVSYNINTELLGADLAKITQIVEPGARSTTGKVNCLNVNLRGNGTSWETVGGTGTIQLREANIYGAPVMVQLLRELRIKETDSDAGMFSSMDVNFRLSGLQMFFNPVIFEGGAISLFGDGMMRLDNRQIDLTMRTRLGNRRTQIPLISDLIGGVSDQLVQFKITGPLGEPVVNRVAVPEVQKALQQIQMDGIAPATSNEEHSVSPRKFQWKPF